MHFVDRIVCRIRNNKTNNKNKNSEAGKYNWINGKSGEENGTKEKTANGYVLLSSLVCLFLMLQVCALSTIHVARKAELARAQHQSTLDLSIYAQARKMAAENAYARRCSIDGGVVEEKEVRIDGIPVIFTDMQTCIQAVYANEGQEIMLELFYNEKGLVSSKWNVQKAD